MAVHGVQPAWLERGIAASVRGLDDGNLGKHRYLSYPALTGMLLNYDPFLEIPILMLFCVQ